MIRKSRDEIMKTLKMNAETIRRYGVTRLGLFGSFARGKGTGASDLDFVVEFQAKSFDTYMDLKMFLEDLFDCKVDLVLVDSIKPRLRETILRETIYASGL